MISDTERDKQLEKLYQTSNMSVPQTRAALAYVEGLLKDIIVELGYSAKYSQGVYIPEGPDGCGLIMGSYDRYEHQHPVKLSSNGLPKNWTVFHAYYEFPKMFHEHHNKPEQFPHACKTGLARMAMLDYASVENVFC